jgi:hypothetical protein
MILTLAGLAFKAHSPSDLQLISLRDDVGTGDTVHVRFNLPSPSGSPGPGKWVIEYRQPNGHSVTRVFPSRDAAINLIAERVQS